MSKRVALYVRVSTKDQSTENQERELRQWAERTGLTVADVFRDEGISGSKGRDKRPGFDRLRRAVVRREVDVVAAWSVDRLGRSLQHLIETLHEIHGAGVDLYLHQQAIDTRTPGGKALFQMMGVFAEFERAMIVERVNAGMARARAAGKHLGRAKVGPEVETKVRELRATGMGKGKIARTLGVGVSTVVRIVDEVAA